jgi:hypothetical protein
MRDDDDPEALDPDDPRLDAGRSEGRGSRSGGTPLARPPGAADEPSRRGRLTSPGSRPPLPVEDRPPRRSLPKFTLSQRRRTMLVIAATAIVTYWVVDACEGGGGNSGSPAPTVTVTVTVPAGQTGPVGDATGGTSRGGGSGGGGSGAAPGGTASTPQPPAQTTPPVSFSGRLTLDVRQFSSVNLDGEPPVVQRNISDLQLEAGAGGLVLRSRQGRAAPSPAGAAPSYASCRDQTTTNAQPELPIRAGTVVCVQSGARRVGYLRTVSVTGTTAVFEAMLWQPS